MTLRLNYAPRIAMVTGLFGAQDELQPPTEQQSAFDCYCYTDLRSPVATGWRLRPIERYTPNDRHNARLAKIGAFKALHHYDYIMWTDANIRFHGDVHQYIDIMGQSIADIGLIDHPYRDDYLEEMKACISLGKASAQDARAAVWNQFSSSAEGLPQRLFETGVMLIDTRAPALINFFADWLDAIEIGSLRDQISLPDVLTRHDIRVCSLMEPGVHVRVHPDFSFVPHKESTHTPDMYCGDYDPALPRFSETEFCRFLPNDTTKQHDKITVVICVYNAFEDVKRCLASVLACGRYTVIVVDDGSATEVRSYLTDMASREPRLTVHLNPENVGYVESANTGMKLSDSPFTILLNSDTIVSARWADKLWYSAYSDEAIGIVSPMSNAAGAQSLPSIKSEKGNTAINQMPSDWSLEDLNLALEDWSLADFYPEVELLHGFCLGIKREVFDTIGYFDSENFTRYFGEENDFCFRAVDSGFRCKIATDTFIYHVKSMSISDQDRAIFTAHAGRRLREIYGKDRIQSACRFIEEHPLLERLRYLSRQVW